MNNFQLTDQQWTEVWISLAILIGTAILARPILTFILDRVIKRITGRTKTSFDDVIIDTVRPPLYWVVLITAGQIALDQLSFLTESLSTTFDDVLFIFYTLVFYIITFRLVNNLSEWYRTEIAPKTDTNLDEQLIPFLRRILLIIVGIIAAIILLDYFNIEVSGLITTLGIGSLAIALAAQAALADTISGFMIMIDRPFRIGDRIDIQALSTWGDVVDIGLRSTQIRTRDNRMVVVPNSVIAKSLIVNYSYPNQEYRIQIEIGVAYGSDIEFVRKTLISAVEKVEGVSNDHPVEALFLQFGESALTFRIRWWIDTYVDTRRMFDKVNTAMYHALNQANVEIPFPQQDIHHKIDEGDEDQFSKVLGK